VLDAVYHKYQQTCVRYLLGRVISRDTPNRQDLAAELFTEALIVLARNARTGRLTELSARLDTYLNAIARNLYLKYLRNNRVDYRDPGDLPPPLVETADDGEPERVRRLLYGRLRELGPRCRQLIVHFYFLDLDWNTISDLLGYKNANSAKNNKAKCMLRLRALYGITKSSKPS
jgi:RNA polymerase sigma-70 factor (ECF subfamily)